MARIKSYSVGHGDMFYISHNGGSFTIIDCNLTGQRDEEIIIDLMAASKGKSVSRFISTHPDEDHFCGIEKLDTFLPISNFYVVKNDAYKPLVTKSFRHYRFLRDGNSAFYLHKDCARKWLNVGDDNNSPSGLQILWPNLANPYFQQALSQCNVGANYNNVSAIVRYELEGGASVLWLGDLETSFMESIKDDVHLTKTTIVFAAHHGRASGKIPNSWLDKLDPQIIVIGEAPSRHLNYYSGYKTVTQNSAGDLVIELIGNYAHFFASNERYRVDHLDRYNSLLSPNYVGSLTVEVDYTP